MTATTDTVAARTLDYIEVPAVVGFEGPFLDRLEADLRLLGRSVERRPSLVVAPGPANVAVSAHADRHGLLTAESGTVGYAARSASGSHRPLKPAVAAQICQRFENEAVVAYDPSSGRALATGTVDHAMHCGIGPELALEVDEFRDVPPGIPVAFAAAARWDGVDLAGQLDNVVSVAIAVELVASGFPGTVLFTCGEEAGRSWEPILDWFDRPFRNLVVLDTSPFDDMPPGPPPVVLRHRDATAAFDPTITDLVARSAESCGTPVVFKDDYLAGRGEPLGRTELGRLVQNSGGTRTGTTLQVATTSYHSNHEMTVAGAIGAVLRVIEAVVDSGLPA